MGVHSGQYIKGWAVWSEEPNKFGEARMQKVSQNFTSPTTAKQCVDMYLKAGKKAEVRTVYGKKPIMIDSTEVA